ncbi:UNVERIFIED_CONTAM: hypothetical protein RF648_22230 [Kocuria sp. CPCC 205274]
MTSKKSKLQMNISTDLHTRFKRICVSEHKEMSEVIIEFVADYVIGKEGGEAKAEWFMKAKPGPKS